MSINERLFSLLEEKHISQKSLCEATGISIATMSAWKKRGTEPPAKDLYAIANFFNTSVDFFITGHHFDAKQSLSADEKELLSNYAKLDSRGKHKLHTFIYEELDRLTCELVQKDTPASKEDTNSSTSHSESNDIA